MKAICSRKDLFEGVQTAGRAVSSRSSLPILGHLLIRSEEDRLRIAATDLEIGMECTVQSSVQEHGCLTAPARILTEVLSALPDADVAISVDESNVVNLKCGSSDYTILGLPAEDFPMLPEVKDDVSFKIEKAILREGIKKTIFAVSTEEARPQLTGILLILDGESIKLVSTDTHRLCVQDSPIITGQGEAHAIIPQRAMAELSRLLLDEDGDVSINISPSQILFRVDDISMVSRLIEGQFPNYERVIPAEYDKTLTVPTMDFLQSMRRVAIVARENSNRAVLRTVDDKLVATAESGSVGKAYEEMEMVKEGEDVEIAFNAKYLLDMLSVMDTEAVEMRLTGSLSPGIMKGQGLEDYLYVVMPMQIT
ncbi:MAG: DNA polymerase III subunit beta [Armatimonadota bacterium]|nr:DNA polymerase III subunit beta [Armatimonadota bacterium]